MPAPGRRYKAASPRGEMEVSGMRRELFTSSLDPDHNSSLLPFVQKSVLEQRLVCSSRGGR